MNQLLDGLIANFGSLLIGVVALALAYLAMRSFLKLEEARQASEMARFEAERTLREERLEFEKRRFRADRAFRLEQYRQFREPAADLAKNVAEVLRQNPDWARQALEAANLASYTHTIFGERSHHFSDEKSELAKRFCPYLISRCRHMIENEEKSVYLLIDAGTTLYPFFQLLGQETARAVQGGEQWVKHLHLATNNLPGLEQLMKWGRRVTYERYSPLAIEDCRLLPGIPMPVFAAVAGKETRKAITELKKEAESNSVRGTTFIALVVGNWVRIRRTEPRCPVPMARGPEHCEVKISFVKAADEVFVVSPLAKNFVGRSNAEVNEALGFSEASPRPERKPYEEVDISGGRVRRVKLVSTFRDEGSLLFRHSVHLEEALEDYGVSGRNEAIGERGFSEASIEEIPHLLYGFRALPAGRLRQMEVEFPHYETRRSRVFLRMFHCDLGGPSGWIPENRPT